MKKTTLLIILLILLVVLISIFLINQTITGKAVQNNLNNIYTHTKAICNKSNFCQDYEK